MKEVAAATAVAAIVAVVRGIIGTEAFTHSAYVFLALGGIFGWISMGFRVSDRKRNRFVDDLLEERATRGQEILDAAPQDVLDEITSEASPDPKGT